MEVLLSQRVNYAEITPFKNYSEWTKEKSKTQGGTSLTFNFKGGNDAKNHFKTDTSFRLEPIIHHRYVDKTTNELDYLFDYSRDEMTMEKISHVDVHSYITDNDEVIKKNFNDPFVNIKIFIEERTITKKENGVIVFKSYKKVRYRNANSKYFLTRTTVNGVTFNTNNGNFTVFTVGYKSSKKRRSSSFRTNNFSHLRDLMLRVGGPFRLRFDSWIDHKFNLKLSEIFSSDYDTSVELLCLANIRREMNDDVATSKFFQVLGIHDGSTHRGEGRLGIGSRRLMHTTHIHLKGVIQWFAERRNIKVPNQFDYLIGKYYPGEFYLKKNQRKLVQSILDSYGLKNKFINRLVHQHLDRVFDFHQLQKVVKIFGKNYPKYLSSIDTQTILENTTKQGGGYEIGADPIKFRRFNFGDELYDNEYESLVSIFNSYGQSEDYKNSAIINLIEDHIRFRQVVIRYDETFRISARTYQTFLEEHTYLTNVINHIRKGRSVEYVYDNRMVRHVETKIDNRYRPFILKNESDYSEEGLYMGHCVATYSDKEASIIISVRDEQTKDRVTCEYNKKDGNRIQSRYFKNQSPPENFIGVIERLDTIVLKQSKKRMLDHIEKKVVLNKIFGKEISDDDIEGTIWHRLDF